MINKDTDMFKTKENTNSSPDYHMLIDELKQLRSENTELRGKLTIATQYIRKKVNQLLTVMGTSPLKHEELDDKTLIETDPIGIVSNSFTQILRHLHKTNEKLKITSEEIQAIFDSAGMGILVIDREMRIIAYNIKMKEQFLLEESDMTGYPCFSSICNFDSPERNCPFIRIFETGESYSLAEWVLKDRFYNVVGAPVRDSEGNVSRIVLVYMDITERKKAEEALRESEEKYRDLFENANDLIQSVGSDGSILYVNRAWCEVLGYSMDEIPSLSIFDVIHPDCDDCGAEFRSVVFGERGGRIETSFITKDRGKIIVEGNVNLVSEGGKFLGTRGIFRDITERRRIKDALASEKEQLAVTLRSIGDGVITTDIHGNIVLINKMAEIITGWKQEEAAGKPVTGVFRIINEKTRLCTENPVESVLKNGKIVEIAGDTLLVAKDGMERVISDSVAPIMDKDSVIIGTVLVFRDITEKRKIEEKISKAEKIESLGVLAGGIAHDFNNLLNAIIGNIDLAKMSLDPGQEAYETLIRAEKATLRAGDLTKQLLTFSRGGAPVKKTASVNELIKDSAGFALRGANVRCEFVLPDDLWKVELDEGQFSQVINNLVLNAVQAMPEGGLLRIQACNIFAGTSDRLNLHPGRYVKIIVQDEGCGISKAQIDRIFEPYFTTKKTGSGLGLATTYSIIRSHEGLIDVESDVGKGAIFLIYLPAFSGDAESVAAIKETIASDEGKGRVLLMDDEEFIRMAAGDMLERLGYEVDLAVDGNEAIEMYIKAKESGRSFDAVIMDLTIPGGMGGKETITKLIEIDPDVRAIVSSGYSSDSVMANYKNYGFAGVLAKPYRRKDLMDVLREVISIKT